MIKTKRSLPLDLRWDCNHNIKIDSRQAEVSDFQVWYGDANGVEMVDNLWTREDKELFFNGEAGQEEVDQTPKSIYELLTRNNVLEALHSEPSLSNLLDSLDLTHKISDSKMCQVGLHLIERLISIFFEKFVSADIPNVHRPEFLRRYLHGKSKESKLVKTKQNSSKKFDAPVSRDVLFDFFTAIAECMSGAISPLTSSFDESTSMMIIIGALDHLYHQNKLVESTLTTERSNSWKDKMEYRSALKSACKRGSFINSESSTHA